MQGGYNYQSKANELQTKQKIIRRKTVNNYYSKNKKDKMQQQQNVLNSGVVTVGATPLCQV